MQEAEKFDFKSEALTGLYFFAWPMLINYPGDSEDNAKLEISVIFA